MNLDNVRVEMWREASKQDAEIIKRPIARTSRSDCSTLTHCEICNQDCGTMAGLIVHVRKFHPAANAKSEVSE